MTESPRTRRAALPVPTPWLAFALALGLVAATVWLFSREPEPLPSAAERFNLLAQEFPQDADLLVQAGDLPAGWSEARVQTEDDDGRLTQVVVSYELLTEDPDGAGGTLVDIDVCSARDLALCEPDGGDVVVATASSQPSTVVLLRDPDFADEVAASWSTVELRTR